ncbi:MAG: PaaI family thioesterase [Pseudomonadales bacterium]|nr:PaaI family thioesterase [Pseudomonadales bacterium]
MPEVSIQEKMRPNHCFGCGLDNPHGLQIRSYWDGDGDEVICSWTPKDHMTGPPNFLYGGTSASLIDCHSVNAAVAFLNRQQGFEEEFNQELRMVTGTMTVKYLKPVPMKPLDLRAVITKVDGRKYTVKSTISCDGTLCVTGEVIAIRINAGQLKT